jgi:single-stranded-DNA-specific exonuclease
LIMVSNSFMRQESFLEKRWEVKPPLPDNVDHELGLYSPYLRQILYNRGIVDASSAEKFLSAQPPTSTDPFLLKDMCTAVERLWQAVQNKEPIAVYGDYDVDGVTACVLMVEVLRAAGAQVEPYIPNRFEEGYGLNIEALRTLSEKGIRLVVTVDCGARSPREADFARTIGVDLIISDHHHPAAEIPQVVAFINPKQPGDVYPDKDLAGVGLAYKLAEGLLQRHPLPDLQVDHWLDLVALGTIADMAPLIGENRALVANGIQHIRSMQRQGLVSLAGVAAMKIAAATSSDIGFILGPRLNAAGRLESALDAFNLLACHDVQEAGMLAQNLDNQNRTRQTLTKEIQIKAAEIALQNNPGAALLFAADPQFNEGVVGLAASRLVETYYRPAIVAHKGEDNTRGSCRSIPEFHITDALDQCADLLVRYGGHKAAAGFTVQNQNLDALIARLQDIATQALAGTELRPVITADYELTFELFTQEYEDRLFADLDRLQPTGTGNPEPIFLARNMGVVSCQAVGKDASHLRLSVADSLGSLYPAIAFRQGKWATHMPRQIDLMFTLEKDYYNNQSKTRLNVKDLRPSVTPSI